MFKVLMFKSVACSNSYALKIQEQHYERIILRFKRLYRFKDEAQTALFKDPVPYRAVNTFHLSYKTQSVYAVSGTSHCLFSDKYKTHNSVWTECTIFLNIRPVGASRNQ